MEGKKEDKYYFTKENYEAIGRLPEKEQELYYRKLAAITGRVRVASDEYEKVTIEIEEDLDVLVAEILKRLKEV